MREEEGKNIGKGPTGKRGMASQTEKQGTTGAQRPRAKRWRKVPASKGVVCVDEAHCLGCRTCEAICSLYHEGVVSPELSRILVVKDWTRPNTMDVEFEPVLCEQCLDAPCLQNCTTGALKIDKGTHARIIDQALCIGCHDCEKACSYTPSRIRFNKAGKAFKCDLCGGNPQCVKFCHEKALSYVHDDNGIAWTGYPVMRGV